MLKWVEIYECLEIIAYTSEWNDSLSSLRHWGSRKILTLCPSCFSLHPMCSLICLHSPWAFLGLQTAAVWSPFLYFPNSLPSTVVPVTAVYIPKLGSFPQPCLSPPNTSQFAHFSSKCDVQNKHSFSVLEVTDGQKAVCLLCVWRTACLSEIFDCSFLLSVTESGQDRAVHTFLPTHPDPLKTTQYLPINAT